MGSDDEITPILDDHDEQTASDRIVEDARIRGINDADVESSTINASDDSQTEVELKGCGASALCDPRRMPHRFIALFLMCLLGFGSTFCYDNPGALQDNLRSDMGINTAQFANLYAWYSWPNVICCFIGGFLLDR